MSSERKLVRTYYRSITPDRKVWCESKDPQEVLRMSEGKDCTFQTMRFYETTEGWGEWPARGASDDQRAEAGEAGGDEAFTAALDEAMSSWSAATPEERILLACGFHAGWYRIDREPKP